MKRRKWGLITVIVVTLLALAVAIPREDVWLSKLGVNQPLKVRLGLDLQGGAQLVYQADLSKVNASDKTAAMESLTKVIGQRVNPGGTSEVTIQTSGADRVIIELPGVKDLNEAIGTIGKTADLQFSEVKTSNDSTQIIPIPTGLSGKDVQRATVDFDPQTSQPIVSLQLKSGQPTQKFGELTTRINKEGSRLLVTLDQDIVFGPATVSSPITDGKAVLQGNFTATDAKKTAQLINAGALPVPISLVEQRTVGATLGQQSIAKSIVAGIIGLTVVALFMILYYRLAGVIAVAALGIYTLITLALYKLSGISPSPIVLTLAGIAGFVLSIGMAVDANILIFERTKEEYRGGKEFISAVESGFDRAWSSIRDSNVSTLITCAILFIFAGSVPIIKGFAVTLALGVLISMFTAITVSRTLLRMVMRTKWGSNPKLYGFKAHEEANK
jgi:preprotein translocase subunit SecD